MYIFSPFKGTVTVMSSDSLSSKRTLKFSAEYTPVRYIYTHISNLTIIHKFFNVSVWSSLCMDSIGNLKLNLQPKHEYKVYSSCQVNFKQIIVVDWNYMGL